MKTTSFRKWQAVMGLVLAALTFIAWKSADPVQPYKAFSTLNDQDTSLPFKKIKDKKEISADELDHAMKGLDKAMIDVDKNLKLDFSKMDIELKNAMEEIKKVDFEKISREVEASIKKIDWEKTRTEVDKALQQAQLKLKEVDMKKIQQELELAQKNISKEKIMARIDVEKIKKQVEEGMAKAKVGIEKAKKELGLLKEFTNELEKDGLINKKNGYKIEIKNKKLFINGKEQSKKVNDKYSRYLDREDISIVSDGDKVSN